MFEEYNIVMVVPEILICYTDLVQFGCGRHDPSRQGKILYRFFHTLPGLSLLSVTCSKALSITQELPNILLIVIDAARTDHFSCYGYHRLTTPNLERVAAEGLRFTCAVSSSSWTLPAQTSLFTGLLPEEHGTRNRHAWLIDRIPTLAELLKARGDLLTFF